MHRIDPVVAVGLARVVPSRAKQRVSVLQGKLRAAFGLDDSPFHKFRVVDGWRAKFFARSDIAEAET